MVLPIIAAGAVSSGVLIMALAVVALFIFLGMTKSFEGITLVAAVVACVYFLV